MMEQFYEGVPHRALCEAARIDGLSEYGIYAHIMLPLSLPAVSTLVIFTFVNTWNDFLGPLIHLTKTELKTIQTACVCSSASTLPSYGLIVRGFRCRTDPGPDRIPVLGRRYFVRALHPPA